MAHGPASVLSIAVALCIMLEEGKGNPALESDLAPISSTRHLRTKRCSCNSWLDKECIYFCHLDIIWVNTPGQTSPYGLGNPTRRRKRALTRCGCSNPNDSTCSAFCQPKPRDILGKARPEETKPAAGSREQPKHGALLLRVLRDVAVSNSLHSKWRRSLQKIYQQRGLPWKSAVWKKRR